jgi:MraZ protein
VSETVFRGTSALALDAKGRITMPVRHREQLLADCNGELTLTRHPEGYLLVYPRPTWLTRSRGRVVTCQMAPGRVSAGQKVIRRRPRKRCSLP